MMHSEQAKLVEWFTEETNDATARTCRIEPGRFRGIASMPQSMETTPERWTRELRRCVTELGFVGAMLNTDPCEGTAHHACRPLSERFWYPVWEAVCELDVPVLIHSAGCRPPARESYSLHFIQEETLAVAALLSSSVLDDFPALKIIVSHGGGAIPYQRGRFQPGALRAGTTVEEPAAQALLRHLPVHAGVAGVPAPDDGLRQRGVRHRAARRRHRTSAAGPATWPGPMT